MKIGIYGLGLIGGSLLKALHGYEKIAITGNDSPHAASNANPVKPRNKEDRKSVV